MLYMKSLARFSIFEITGTSSGILLYHETSKGMKRPIVDSVSGRFGRESFRFGLESFRPWVVSAWVVSA